MPKNVPIPKDLDEMIPTRESLLSRLKDWNDGYSWRDFFQTYWKFIYAVAIRSGLTKDEAQEVVQETIINISKQMPDFKYDRSQGSFKGWLAQLTRWRIKDQLRKRLREVNVRSHDTRHEEILPHLESADPSTDAICDEEWQRNLVESAILKVRAQIRPKQFQMFDLYVIKQWPIQKITATLRVNFAQVYLAKYRVTALIKKEISKQERRF